MIVKKYNKFLILFFMIFTMIFGIENVYGAGDNIESGSDGEAISCGGSYCYSGATGFRVTFVQYIDGEFKRCNYDKDKHVICTKKDPSTNPNVVEMKSIDYWPFISQLRNYTSSYCRAYTGKLRTKYEFIKSSNKDSNIGYCGSIDKNASSKPYGTNQYSYKHSLHKMTNVGFVLYCGNSPCSKQTDYDEDQHDVLRKGVNISKSILDFKNKFNSSNATEKAKGKAVMANLINFAVPGGDDYYINNPSKSFLVGFNSSENSDTHKALFVQFDQLLHIASYNNKTDGKAAIGTVAEATYLILHDPNSYPTQCLSGNKFNGFSVTPVPCANWQSTAYSFGYWTGWYGGDGDLNVTPPSGILGLNPSKDLEKNSEQDLTEFYQMDSANVAHVWFGVNSTPSGEESCEKIASDLIQETKNVETFSSQIKSKLSSKNLWNSSYSWLQHVKDYGYTTAQWSKLKTKVANSCSAPKCTDVYELLKNDSEKFTNYLNGHTLESGKYWAYIMKKTFGSDLNLAENASNMCKYGSCGYFLSKLTNKSETNLNKLYAATGSKYNLLKKEFYDELNNGTPSCDNDDTIPTPDECPAKVEGDCSTGSITFSTATDAEKCIKKKFAYLVSTNKFQGSKFSNFSNDVVCDEKVVFDLPKNVDKTKSGTLLKWGSNFTSGNELFGKMTISKQCYTLTSSINKVLKWDTTVNPYIRVKYYKYIDEKWTEVQKNDGQDILLSVSNPVSVRFNDEVGETYTDSSLKTTRNIKGNKFSVVAMYNIDFGKTMTWYSLKGQDATNISEIKYDAITNNDEKKNYIFVGYGLPTSLSSPDGSYNGKLLLEVSNVGTYTNGKYMFDKLQDGNSYTNYKCDFVIHNELFGNECCEDDPTNPGKMKIIDGAPSYCTCDGEDRKTPKGLDVVFRTIELVNKVNSESTANSELDKAFPGKTGTGFKNRKIGKNWSSLLVKDDGSYDADFNKEGFKILNSDIYKRTPQYQFKLTSSGILKIRDYNKKIKNSGKDPYVGVVYADTSNSTNGFPGFVCKTNDDSNKIGNYSYCTSHFITQLASEPSTYAFKINCISSTGTTENRTNMSTEDRALAGACGQEWYNTGI